MTLLLAKAGRETDPSCPFPYFPPAARALVRLQPKGCRWPLGEPSALDFAFCQERRATASCYCAAHRRLARRCFGSAG